MTHLRQVATALLLAALAAGTAVAGGGPAAADQAAYRYWAYWHGEGGRWTFAGTGPGGYHPVDGDVEGWRFGVSDTAGERLEPRAAADFAALCAGTPARAGAKRVAVVVDYGLAADAPRGTAPPPARGACARVPADATGAAVIGAVARPRWGDGLLCALDGYPATGCADVVREPAATRTPEPTPTLRTGAARPADRSGGGPVAVAVGLAAAALLGGAALARSRRRA